MYNLMTILSCVKCLKLSALFLDFRKYIFDEKTIKFSNKIEKKCQI